MKAHPGPKVSGRYLAPKAPLWCTKWIPDGCVMSVKRTGAWAQPAAGNKTNTAIAAASSHIRTIALTMNKLKRVLDSPTVYGRDCAAAIGIMVNMWPERAECLIRRCFGKSSCRFDSGEAARCQNPPPLDTVKATRYR